MRLFVAIDLTQSIVDSLKELRRQLEPLAGNARWVRRESMHLTLKFLGEVSTTRLDSVKERLTTIQRSAFKVTVSGVGFFPNVRAPRVFWVGVGSQDLEQLARDIEKRMTELDFPRERRKFTPHLTLARSRRDGRMNRNMVQAAEKFRDQDFGMFTADRFYLYESQLNPSGAIYKKLDDYPLA